MDLSLVRKIYFVGIGGIGMSAAAGLAQEQGFEVLGSDSASLYPPASEVLAEHGIQVHVGYSAEHIAASGADIFVISSGEDDKNPEVAWLLETNTPYISFPELLYELSREKLRVVVAGTHGKSTTAGWLGHALRNIDNSSYMVGGVLKNYDANFYSGDGHYSVFEGDEYKSLYDDPTPKMHYYKGDVLVLTNLEYDHPDVFANLEEIKGEFQELVAHLPEDGIIIYNADNQNLSDVVYREPGRSFTFGLHNAAHMKVKEVSHTANGVTEFVVENTLDPDNAKVEVYHSELPGEINIYNALATVTTLRALGFQPELVDAHLRTYEGIKRRFEVLSEAPITVVDDYAHHATAVRETLSAAREKFFSLKGHTGKLWAVFEPHMFSRTKATLPELAESFNSADEVLLAPMYGAREHANTIGITDADVIEAIAKHQPHVRLIHSKAEGLQVLEAEVRPGDVVVVMAVGSFNRLGYELVEKVTK